MDVELKLFRYIRDERDSDNVVRRIQKKLNLCLLSFSYLILQMRKEASSLRLAIHFNVKEDRLGYHGNIERKRTSSTC